MLSDEFPEFDIHAPDPQAPSSFVIHLHVDDADAMIATAVAAGARLVRAPQDHFYGERSATLRDPFGYDWMIGHSIEDIAPEEMQRRYTAMLAGSRSEEHTSELQSLMRISYAVFCLKKKKQHKYNTSKDR